MQPAGRIALLLVVVAALPFLPQSILLAALAVVALSLLLWPLALRAHVLQGIWRVRWLLFAVLALYLFLSPGVAPELRLLDACARLAVLICAVAAVRVALHGLDATQMADGLTRVLAPFRLIGLAPEVFARRLTLTLDAVPEVQELIASHPLRQGGRPLSRLADRAAAVIAAIEARA